MIDDIIEEAKKTYSEMSLLELLAYENVLRRRLYEGRPDNKLKILDEMLCSEIQKKLQ
ncbi:MAG: hypothetical protein ACE5J2_00660 [Nitrososphaerales archaeon]